MLAVQIIEENDIDTVLDLIPKNCIMSVKFLKKDNTERVMNCRRSVKKYLNPNPSRPRPTMPANEVTVYDLKAKGYRMFNKETLVYIHAMGVEFKVER